MSVAVSRRRTPGNDQRTQITIFTGIATLGLMHDCALGAGVRVRVDAADPRRWQAILVDSWDDDVRSLLKALIGAQAVRQLEGHLCHLGSSAQRPGQGSGMDRPDKSAATHELTSAEINLRAARPWLRVAAVEALDRWLHLPLNQALIDAELGVARGQAARTLRPGRVRDAVLGDGLRLARAASAAFVHYLGRLARSPRPVPETLRKVLNEVIEGYQELSAELPEPDRELRSVIRAGRQVLDRLPSGVDAYLARPSGRDRRAQRAVLARHPGSEAVSLLDPRQIPARVLRLSENPAIGEVRMRAIRANGREAVALEIPAYGPGGGNLRGGCVSERLLVRLIDTVTGDDVETGLLILEGGSERACPLFRGVVLRPSVPLARLRADVTDGTSGEPPANSDADPELIAVREAALALAARRHATAAERLSEFSGGDGTLSTMIGAADLLVAEIDAASGLIDPLPLTWRQAPGSGSPLGVKLTSKCVPDDPDNRRLATH
jgi:hypothetical protein